MNLTKNFTLAELTKSPTARRKGFDEQGTPDGVVISNLTYLAQKILEPIRGQFGAFTVSSGYRCKRLNDYVGSSDTSFHLQGMAVDIDLGSRNKDLLEFIKKNLPFTELINEYPDKNGNPDWVHVAISRGRENEKKVKTIQ
jgi:uncharacterized protein YcbK (DUF882 family)